MGSHLPDCTVSHLRETQYKNPTTEKIVGRLAQSV